MKNFRDSVTGAFTEQFGDDASVLVRAPGRVNIIGEHTDYNDGFVLPIAIDREIWIALRPRTDRTVVVHSLDFDSVASFELGRLEREGSGWVEYVKGMAWGLQSEGHELTGWEGVVGGNVPRGAGLSSSAAIELAVAGAFAAVSGLSWDAKAMALLGQRVENQWIGVQCGIMDQMIVAVGRRDCAVLIDCRSLDLTYAPLPADTSFVILDTSTRRGLVDSEYNERRARCEAAARHLGVPALRDVDEATFRAEAGGLPELTARRARHVITENARTLEAVAAMKQGDAARLGQLIDASHVSLRDEFGVSSPELDAIVEIAREQEGCLGARMTGAGFGGCAIALVRSGETPAFSRAVSQRYHQDTGHIAQLYVCAASDGAGVVSNSHHRPE